MNVKQSLLNFGKIFGTFFVCLALLYQFVNCFMIPGEFDRSFFIITGVVFLLGLAIAVLAGCAFCWDKEAQTINYKSVLTSFPVLLFLAGSIVLALYRYATYVPRVASGHGS